MLGFYYSCMVGLSLIIEIAKISIITLISLFQPPISSQHKIIQYATAVDHSGIPGRRDHLIRLHGGFLHHGSHAQILVVFALVEIAVGEDFLQIEVFVCRFLSMLGPDVVGVEIVLGLGDWVPVFRFADECRFAV